MEPILVEAERPKRTASRGFSPAAAVAILVGVTAASVAGFLVLCPHLVPQASGGPGSEPGLSAPAASPPAELLAADRAGPPPVAAVTEPPEASGPRATPATGPRDRPGPALRPRLPGQPGAGSPEPRRPPGDSFGANLDDPLANIDFGEIEG